MPQTLKLISTHRLDPEKWWDLILWWLKSYLSESNETSHRPYILYDIYGDGVLRPEIEELARLYPDQIIYHGYVTLAKVFEYSTDYDFVMMPSHFIETFGLSSLDFNQFGVPTIGFQKGGLRQFISNNLDIYKAPGDTVQEKFNNLMSQIVWILESGWREWLKKTYSIDKEEIISKYGFPWWVEKFSTIVW